MGTELTIFTLLCVYFFGISRQDVQRREISNCAPVVLILSSPFISAVPITERILGLFGLLIPLAAVSIITNGFGMGDVKLCAAFGWTLGAFTAYCALAAALTAAGLDTFANIPFLTGYTAANLPIVLYIYIGVTGIGFTCYFLSMEVTSAQTTSLVFFFKPALAPLLAFLILHEAIPGNMLAGIACILCGSLASILPGLLAQRRAVPAAVCEQGPER